MILIDTYQQYQDFLSLGFEPLIDWRRFELEIRLRVQLQRSIFGHRELTKSDDLPRANERFYKWVYDHKIHTCEETGQPINHYAAINISHIITRGSHPEMAHDPRNTNLLIPSAHARWESGKVKGMKIYPQNKLLITMLKTEYSKL